MKFPICDTHNDFLTELEIDKIPEYVKTCKKQNVKTICASYWSSKKDKNSIFDDIKNRFEIATIFAPEYLLHIEDLWFVQNKKDLQKLIDLRPFSCSLTWNGENDLAGGIGSSKALSKFGKECVLTLFKNNILIDTAHLNQKSFLQVTNILPKNIYCSHTGFCGIKNHNRNLTDEQISKIVKSDGFVGLFFFDKCIQTTTNFSMQDICDNLRYFTNKFGFDNIGFGTDFFGIEKYPNNLKNYKNMQKLAIFLEKTYKISQIEKIFYKNFESFSKLFGKNV